MMTVRRVSILVPALVAAGGCQDAAYEQALAQREQRIHQVWSDYMTAEAGRPVNIEKLHQTATDLQAVYAERLKHTLQMIENKRLEDERDWVANEPARLEALQKMFEGNPDQIPKTWGDMTY